MRKTRGFIFFQIIIVLFFLLFPALYNATAFNFNLPFKNDLKPGDEGAHFIRYIPVIEWWYFNVVFNKENSDLRDWSAMISFNHGSNTLEKPDILFITLYDDENKTYGGMINKDRNTLQAIRYGMNITFENSWVTGIYPQWYLHVEDEDADLDHEIIMDLYFKAKSLPYWVGMNTGHGSPRSLIGYYSINHCEVSGYITIDGKVYRVFGTGYHDHTWAPYFKIASGFWDWFSIHFDNGLHAFIWILNPIGKNSLISITPRFCWITDGQNFTDIKFFKMEYLEFENTSIPGFIRPKKYHISSSSSFPKIDLYLETKNIHEYLWQRVSTSSITGMWEGTCSVNGTMIINSNVSDITGSAIAEIIRII